MAKKHNIPRIFNRGKTYWSKKHIDNYFSKKAANPEITEWYTVQEIQDKFDMTLAAIYTLASKNAIPKKKEGIMVWYSKKHFDIAKGIVQPKEPQYYTVAEAMENSISPETSSIIMPNITTFPERKLANTLRSPDRSLTNSWVIPK